MRLAVHRFGYIDHLPSTLWTAFRRSRLKQRQYSSKWSNFLFVIHDPKLLSSNTFILRFNALPIPLSRLFNIVSSNSRCFSTLNAKVRATTLSTWNNKQLECSYNNFIICLTISGLKRSSLKFLLNIQTPAEFRIKISLLYAIRTFLSSFLLVNGKFHTNSSYCNRLGNRINSISHIKLEKCLPKYPHLKGLRGLHFETSR